MNTDTHKQDDVTARVPVTGDSLLSNFATGPNGERYYLIYDGLFQGLTHKRGMLIPNKVTQVAVRHAHRKYQLLSASMCGVFLSFGLSIEELWTAFGGRHQAGVFMAVGLILGVYVSRLYASKQMARELASFECVPVKPVKVSSRTS